MAVAVAGVCVVFVAVAADVVIVFFCRWFRIYVFAVFVVVSGVVVVDGASVVPIASAVVKAVSDGARTALSLS